MYYSCTPNGLCQPVENNLSVLTATIRRFHSKRLRKLSITIGLEDRQGIDFGINESGRLKAISRKMTPETESKIEELLDFATDSIFRLESAKIEVRGRLRSVTYATLGRIANGTEDYRPNERRGTQLICSPGLVAHIKECEKKMCSDSRSANCIIGENSDETQ